MLSPSLFMNRICYLALIVGLFITFGISSQAQAHAGSYGYADVSIGGQTIKMALYIDQLTMLQFPGVDANHDQIIDQQELQHAYEQVIRPYIENGLLIENHGQPLTMTDVSQSIPDLSLVRIDLLFQSSEPIDTITIKYNLFFERSQNQHTNIATFHTVDGKTFEHVFDEDHKVWTGTFGKVPGFFETVKQFILLGIEHILTGYDHLLFLLALLLVGMSFRDMLKIVTSFTVAHSITLILAAFQIVSIPSRMVETAIALSIVYVAVENLWLRNTRYRWLLTFAFGFIHGFGFASALREIGLPKSHEVTALLTFNLGVEVGQLAIVILLFPLLLSARKYHGFPKVVRILSIMIAAAGAYWFVVRAFVI